MILSKIPEIQSELEEMRTIAPSGFVLAVNVRWIGPEHIHSEFPAKWRGIYEDGNFFMFDPVYYWTVMNTGTTRWSEISYPDPKIVGKRAAEHGLVYGATVCKKTNNRKSFLSAGRADREITTIEITRMEDLMAKWVGILHERPHLSDVELATLKCIREGMDQNQIALKLDVSPSTVKKRLRRIRAAFKAATISEAVSIATEKRYFTEL